MTLTKLSFALIDGENARETMPEMGSKKGMVCIYYKGEREGC